MHLVRVMKVGTGFYREVDDLLLTRARRGDLEALEGLYQTYSRPVFTLARRVCRSSEEAEEVLQETFLEVVRSIRSYRGAGAIGAWVRRIAISKALMAVRRRMRKGGTATIVDHDVSQHVDVSAVSERDGGWRRLDLERALARLPDTTRAVVWLHDVEGLTHSEIAEVFSRTPSFSKSQLSRAHARLRSWLGRTGGSTHASRAGRVAGATRR